jgi:hypothetical protein
LLRGLTTAVTGRPIDLASWMAKVATAPEAPSIRMLSPGAGSAACRQSIMRQLRALIDAALTEGADRQDPVTAWGCC